MSLPSNAPVGANAVDTYIELTRAAAGVGLTQIWFAQLFDIDAISVAALAGRAVAGIEVGTGIVPMTGRHPLAVAQQANTAQAATGGRFTLGIGLGAKAVAESSFGATWDRPIKHLREYLQVLRVATSEHDVDFQGETVVAKNFLPAKVPGATPMPIIVAAMGPQALKVTGELADGTIPFLAVPKVIEQDIVPALPETARVVATFPGLVTSNVDEMKAVARQQLDIYGQIPSYRAVLDKAGLDHAVEAAVIGSEEDLAAEVRRYFDAGATDVVVSHTGIGSAEDRERTWAALGRLAR
ncbi:TIGR03564 family F420-dependent LLM class oxidoreductase [Kibdelosporangium philippinense]|uniref:TIGR03564 family F420-dependent LLM class oxidoreductase n=1 Tax=Kibdelosporangium philippinense TaxID=211113 RepID=A0ABS8ZCV0_9PSEU|nr:TIGR03564 family F420-dependent LLM class oxidoreductase [Kibdelosporangium philippinense]MCE7005272.1 TIGR03564 family F420-dependent LLM class oxidoreductase [Kibdelosporangium philippinense]